MAERRDFDSATTQALGYIVRKRLKADQDVPGKDELELALDPAP